MKLLVLAATLASVFLGQSASGQFSAALLQNGSYWGDGRAEFDLYDAKLMRANELRSCEMQMILMPDNIVAPDNAAPAGKTSEPAKSIPAIRMTQTVTAPVGLIQEQDSSSLFWSPDGAFLLGRFVLAGPGGSVLLRATYRPACSCLSLQREERQGKSGIQDIPPSGIAPQILYEELPLRVRTIDFSKPNGDFAISLVGPVSTSSPNGSLIDPAKISYKINDHSIQVEVRGKGGVDQFFLDKDFPFLLREWKTRDGSQFKLKNSLKADFWNYIKNGDRERALKDPMLRHPD